MGSSPRSNSFTSAMVRMSVRTERKAIRYVTLHFQDRRGAASLRYKNRAEILRVNGSFILYGIVSALELSGTARTYPELV